MLTIAKKIEEFTDRAQIICVPFGKYAGWSGNGNCITLGNIKLYLSWDTVIAFRDNFNGLVVSENLWGTNSGYHLNCIELDHSVRLPYAEFRKKLLDALKENGIFLNLVGMEGNLGNPYW